MTHSPIYGAVAEFGDPTKLVEAARAVREHGYKKFEAYTPYPIKELNEIVPGLDLVPFMVFSGGVSGAVTAWVMQCYIAIVDYPINVGGRPLYSWPAFIPITFELTVLFASIAAFFGSLWLCGFPKIHHPIFTVERMARASKDRFFLCIESRDSKFDPDTTRDFLWQLDPLDVQQVNDD